MRDPDFAFGQTMLTLRTATGLTQADLAARLGVSRNAVVAWETGASYPSAHHLARFVELTLGRKAFPAGAEAAAIRALWSAAHQKVGLDEGWLVTLLAGDLRAPSPVREPDGIAARGESATRHRRDWSDAPNVPRFYGRTQELELLSDWIVAQRCQVVGVLGQGGIGKSSLATQVMHRVAPDFEVVIWRSLRDVPTCEALLDSCLQVLRPQALRDPAASAAARQDLLLDCLRRRRVLLVYDNLESFLAEGVDSGHLRPGYGGFARLLRRVAETAHPSCLLLTSREQTRDLLPLEGRRAPVRALHLARLEAAACRQLLADQEVTGSPEEHRRLIAAYAGNPLALKIVARTIADLFAGQIALFLAHGEVVFGGVRDLLAAQYARLAGIEQTLLLWLAILREPATLPELLAVLSTPFPPAQVLDALESLHRRSLLERGPQPGSFTLQAVVMEYVTAHLIAEVSREIQEGLCARLVEHGLELAAGKEYVRQAQQRLLIAPILAGLRGAYPLHMALEEHLCALLGQMRARALDTQGYGPANLLALLRVQRGHLRDLDLTHLGLRSAYLQATEMQDTRLAGAWLHECGWTATFGSLWAVAISPDGQYWAAGSRRGEIWVWRQQTLHRLWPAHADVVRALCFSPDGGRLASGSYDATLKVWAVASGALLWTGAHPSYISALAYSPDGTLLASGGTDATVRLWDAQTGALRETLPHPQAVFALAWSPDGHLLASLGGEGQIRLWERPPGGPATCRVVLPAHTGWGMGLAFAPDGQRLASAGWDRTIQIWAVAAGGELLQTLAGHADRVQTVAWSPDGQTLASAGFDETIWLWDVASRSVRTVLTGFTGVVFSLAFTPDSRHLLSGSGDGTLRLWDVARGQCEQIRQGYADSLYDVAWSPHGLHLASGGSSNMVSIWDVAARTPPQLLAGHRYLVFGVAWSPDGRWLASSGWDNVIQIWDAHTGTPVQVLRDPDDPYTSFYGLAWSPDGQRLACGNYRQEVQVWEVATGTRQWRTPAQPGAARRVAWSPDGTALVSGGDEGCVAVWKAADGSRARQLPGPGGKVNDVAWSRDGQWLAAAGGRAGGEVCVWAMPHGERMQILGRLPGIGYAVAWSPSGAVLVSGGSDGWLRWWDRASGECVRVCRAHEGTVQRLQVSPEGTRLASCGDDGAIQIWDLAGGARVGTLRRDRPYERLEISGATGLTPAQRAELRALGAVEDPRGGP